MTHIRKAQKFVADERGATAIEYGLIAGCIALVIITAVQQLGATTNVLYQLAAALF
jgi:pilus assembly protein Flp/PilA